MIVLVKIRVLVRLHHEVEGLGEAKQTDPVDDGEGEHVAGDHLEDHGDKGSGELDGPAEEDEVEPGAGHREDEEGFLDRPECFLVWPELPDPGGDAAQEEETGNHEEHLWRRGLEHVPARAQTGVLDLGTDLEDEEGDDADERGGLEAPPGDEDMEDVLASDENVEDVLASDENVKDVLASDENLLTSSVVMSPVPSFRPLRRECWGQFCLTGQVYLLSSHDSRLPLLPKSVQCSVFSYLVMPLPVIFSYYPSQPSSQCYPS